MMHNFACEDRPSLGERYPLDTDCYAPIGEDRNLCNQRLNEDSSELFQIAQGGVDVLWSIENDESQKLSSHREFLASEVVGKHGIQQYVQGHKYRHLIFIIQPVFSWSHLSITEPAFRKLLAGLKIFTPFLRVVHAFGKKTNDKQRARDSAYHRVQTPSAYEFCYNIRYFELNGRGRGNPWSLRQTGVYQRCLSNQQSAWLLLTYSSYIVDRLSAALGEESSSTCEPCEASSLLLHFFILSAATRSWGQYIEDMRRRVMLFEEKAYSSRVDKIYLDDYELLFSDIQKMVSLGGTLAITRTVITGQRDTISKCGDLHAELHKRGPRRCGCDTANALGLLKADLHHYNGAIVDLTQATTKITQLLSAILATRANDKSQITIATIETGIAGLQLQSRQTSQDTASSLQITTQGHKDAIIIKTLAQIATMFLPASLIASLFSSTIFGSSSNRTSAVILYFAITLPLLLVTLLFLIFLEKGWSVGRWFRQFL